MKDNSDLLLRDLYEQINNPEDYLSRDIRSLIINKLSQSSYIEAYVLADQYVDSILKYSFNDVTANNSTLAGVLDRNGYDFALLFAQNYLLLKEDYVSKYRHFKNTRSKFVHRLIANEHSDKVLKYPKKDTSKTIILNHIELFEKFHIDITRIYYKKNLPNEASSLLIINEEKKRRTINKSIIDVFSKKLYMVIQIKLREIEKKTIQKFDEFDLSNKEIMNFIVQEGRKYITS